MTFPAASDPVLIALDTNWLLREFLLTIQRSPDLDAYFRNYAGLELKEFLNNILQYTVDYSTARACVLEFAEEVKEIFVCEFNPSDIELLSQAALKLGLGVLDILIQARLYDHAGECWYTVDHLMGYDVVIRKINLN